MIDNPPFTKKDAEGFYNELAADGWVKQFNWGDDLAWERDFRQKGIVIDGNDGTDYIYTDNVDFFWFGSHGGAWNYQSGSDWYHVGSFGVKKDLEINGKYVYDSRKIKWGDVRLKWAVINTCESLNVEDDKWLKMWDQTFAGLHIILGINGSISALRSGHGQTTAHNLRSGDTVAQAWFKAINEQWWWGDNPAAMAPRYSDTAPYYVLDNDHIFGHGTVVSVPSSPTWFVIYYYE
jgi:hypothetical protein